MVKICLIGAGSRGDRSYGPFILENQELASYVAIVEPNKIKLDACAKKYNIPEENLFSSEDDFYKAGKLGDAVLISNQDKDHYYSVMKCMDLGYDILLEKPITPSEKELEEIGKKAKELNINIMICHVLRYTNFFSTIKDLLDAKEIGEVVGIDHTEYIGNYHMAHSYVRGNWHNSKESSPIVLAKTCHDMDIISWFVDSKVKDVYSIGKLNYFNIKNKPEGSAHRCFDCKLIDTCNYSAKTFYYDHPNDGWIKNVCPHDSLEEIKHFLDTTNYGKCVYEQDNDVCDHQIAIFNFENGVEVTFTLTAFSQDQYRLMRIFGTEGIIEANSRDNEIKVTKFISTEKGEQIIKVIKPEQVSGGHYGGDNLLMADFVKMVSNKNHVTRTSLEQSIQSHKMCYRAEESRVSGELKNI